MDAKKEAALLFWFNIYGTSLKLEDVPSTSQLWNVHIPSLLNCLSTGRNSVCISKDPASTYCDLFQYLSKSQDQSSFVSDLNADGAASGDPLEIAKFLAVLLNEIRISKPYVISQSVAVMELEGHDTPLREIFTSLDDADSEWWSVMQRESTKPVQVNELEAISPAKCFPEEFCFTGMSINASSFVTPRGPSKRKENMYFTAPYSSTVRKEESPLMEIINSPKVRELRRDREMRSMTKKLHDMEDVVAQKETELVDANRKVEALVEELTAKKVRLRDAEAAEKHAAQANEVMEKNITDLEKTITHLKRVVGEQKDRANNYKIDLEKSEEQRNDLMSQIDINKDIVVKTKRELLDLKDELAARDRDVAFLSSSLSKVQRELEEANLATEENKQQYDAAIADIKTRMEQKAAEYLSLYTQENESKVEAQGELKKKKDELEEFKRCMDINQEEMKMKWKETEHEQKQKIDVLNSKLKAVEEELTQKELLWLRKEAEIKESARQFKKEYETETERLEMKISDNKSRIMELETVALERDKVIRKQKENIMTETKRSVIAEDDKIAMKAELDLCKSKLDELHQENSKLLLEITSLKKSIEEKDLELVRLNSSLALEVSRYNELVADVEQERIEHKDEVKTLELRIGQLVSELDKSRMEIHDELLATDALRKDLGLAAAKLIDLQKSSDIQVSALTSSVDELKCGKKVLEDDLTDARSRLDLALKKNMHDLDKINNLTNRLARLEEELSLEKQGRVSESAENKSKIEELEQDLITKTRHNEKLVVNLNEAEAVNSQQLELQNWVKRNYEIELQLLEENAARQNQELQAYRMKADKYNHHINELMTRFELFESSLEKVSTENTALKVEITKIEHEKMELQKRLCELEKERLKDEKDEDKENTIVEVMDLNETVRRKLDFDDSHAINYANQSTVFGDDIMPSLDDEEEPIFMENKMLDGTCNQSEIVKKSSEVVTSNLSMAGDISGVLRRQSGIDSSIFNYTRPHYDPKDVDRDRISELQKRNSMVPAAFRSSYFTETNTYDSPTADENNMKQGKEKEKNGSTRAGKILKRMSMSNVFKKDKGILKEYNK